MVEEREGHAGGKAVGEFAKYLRPKTPELTARDIAGLLRAGRSPEVTDSMLGQADPRLLHELYASGKTGVEMPMDYAARMKRATELGYDQPMYRGTQAREALNRSLQTERSGEGKTSGTGAWLSDNPDIAATYSGHEEFGPVTLPLLARSTELQQVPWGGNLWSQGPEGMTTDQVARLAREQGARGIAFPDVTDVGPHLWSRADLQKRIPETATSFSIFDPSIVRSPFARFDPRLDDLTDLSRAAGGAVEREHHADGDPVGDEQEYPDGARPLTIYRGVAPNVEPGPVDAPMQGPQANAVNDGYVGPMDASVWGRSPTERVPLFLNEDLPASALEQAAYKTPGERFTSALGIENLPTGQTYASQGPTGIERALQVIPNPANYLKRQGEAARENFDMMGQGWNDLVGGNYAAGALGLGGGALGYAMSPITAAERVLFRDPYLNATGNLRDAEAVEMVADTALTGGLRGPAKMLLGKKSMEQLAAEPWRRMRMPSAATAVGAGAAGMTFAPDEAEAAKLPGGEAAARAIQAAKGVIAPQRQLSPLGLYSHGAETAAGLQQAKGTPEQYKAMLMKQGVRPVEFENSGFDTAFAGRPSVTRDEISQHFSQSMPQVEERVLGTTPATAELEARKAALMQEQSAFRPYTPEHTRLADEIQDIREQIVDARNGVSTKFQQYTLPGGENYREVLLKAPDEFGALRKEIAEAKSLRTQAVDDYASAAPGSPEAFEAQNRISKYTKLHNGLIDKHSNLPPEYRHSHWEDPNVLAHIRMSDRTGPNGEKILHVEEVQSDWGQAGRKKGFINPNDSMADLVKEYDYLTKQRRALEVSIRNGDDAAPATQAAVSRLGEINNSMDALSERMHTVRAGIPRGPYVTNTQGWTDLAVKRILKEAAEGGYDKIVWTPGAEQAKRYSLSNQIDELAHWREGDQIGLSASGPNGTVFDQKMVSPEELPALVGQDLSKKILNGEGSARSISGFPEEAGVNFISGDGLSVGGEGMKSYYDQMLPKRFQELVKKHDKEAKLGFDRLPVKGRNTSAADIARELGMTMEDFMPLSADQKMALINSVRNSIKAPSLTMTPQMRESILRGQHAYANGGVVDRALNVINRR
jgi:hypothetical protein